MSRIIGYDVARAVAIAGMVIINFEIVMFAGDRGPGWLSAALGAVEGRAAAMFVVLAGAGASLTTAAARREGDLTALREARRVMLRRAVFLLVAGYLFVLLWPADILHHYAFYIGLGTLLLAASQRVVWLWAVLVAAGFAGLYTFAGYWDQLDPGDLAYEGFWTPVGLVRDLVFNGWHPILPWIAFYLVGMWLGRLDVRRGSTRWRIIGVAAAVAAAAEAIGALNPIVFDVVVKGQQRLGLQAGSGALLAADPLPPGPVFLLAAGGAAVVLVLLCVEAGLRWPRVRVVRWAVATGQLALTLYFAHVAIGMGILEAVGALRPQTPAFTLGAAAVFLALGVTFAVAWRRRFARGPVEALMRRWSG